MVSPARSGRRLRERRVGFLRRRKLLGNGRRKRRRRCGARDLRPCPLRSDLHGRGLARLDGFGLRRSRLPRTPASCRRGAAQQGQKPSRDTPGAMPKTAPATKTKQVLSCRRTLAQERTARCGRGTTAFSSAWGRARLETQQSPRVAVQRSKNNRSDFQEEFHARAHAGLAAPVPPHHRSRRDQPRRPDRHHTLDRGADPSHQLRRDPRARAAGRPAARPRRHQARRSRGDACLEHLAASGKLVRHCRHRRRLSHRQPAPVSRSKSPGSSITPRIA